MTLMIPPTSVSTSGIGRSGGEGTGQARPRKGHRSNQTTAIAVALILYSNTFHVEYICVSQVLAQSLARVIMLKAVAVGVETAYCSSVVRGGHEADSIPTDWLMAQEVEARLRGTTVPPPRHLAPSQRPRTVPQMAASSKQQASCRRNRAQPLAHCDL